MAATHFTGKGGIRRGHVAERRGVRDINVETELQSRGVDDDREGRFGKGVAVVKAGEEVYMLEGCLWRELVIEKVCNK